MRFVPGMRWLARPSARIVSASALAMLVVAFASPADGGTTGLISKIASAVKLTTTPSHTGTPFPGTAAVGALFSVSNGTLGDHFCTASVVHSPHGNLLVTAAHCLSGRTGTIAFVPGYHDGSRPQGVWYVSKVFVDQASLLYLDGAEVDYVDSLEGSGFKFNNPNVKSTCGCGSSFSA